MIKGIGFENFRVFKEMTYFDFAPLTILTGPNNSGKSSLLSGLNLLHNNLSYALSGNDTTFLDKLLTSMFNTSALLEKYGNLKQFINKKGKKNEFSIELRRRIIGLNEYAIIILRVVVSSNLRDGYIKELLVKTENQKEEIIKIYKRTEDISNGSIIYKILVNFTFFHNAYKTKFNNTFNYQNALVELNKLALSINSDEDFDKLEMTLKGINDKFSTNLYWYVNTSENGEQTIRFNDEPYGLPDTIMNTNDFYELLKSKQNIDWVYDFSFLWKDNESQKKEFYNAFLKNYNHSFDESYSLLNLNLLNFLSDVEWDVKLAINQENDAGLFIEYKCGHLFGKGPESDGISLKRFTERFTNVSVDPGFLRMTPENELSIMEELIRPKSLKSRSFYENIFKPLLSEIARQSLKSVSDELILRVNKERKNLLEIDFKDIKHSRVEVQLISLIQNNVAMIESCFREFSNVDFLPADRISRQRTYSYAQKESDHFVSMIYEIEKQNKKEKDDIYKFINEWMKEFGFAEEIKIESDTDTANFKIYIINNSEQILLADFGFGTSQLLPILIKLIPIPCDLPLEPDSSPFMEKIILIEEPESNLHPALQSKLADLFVHVCKKFNTQLIIETHSEYLIRKLQYLRAKGEISESLVSIFYFYPPDKIPPMEQQIKKITIHDDGSLSDDFGSGFFDEADKIAISIWNMNKSQKN